MSSDPTLAINILEKIGAPLIRALLSAPGSTSSAPDDQARQLADLLGKSAHAGITLASRMRLPVQGDQADSVRLALTSLAARLLGGFYRDSGRLPGDRETDRLLSALQALLSFAGGFSGAADDTASRLKALDPVQIFALDEAGVDALFLKAFVPVIEAVGAFSFGRADHRLVQDIAEKLTAHARRIASAAPDLSDKDRRRRELALLAALTDLYAACHKTETRRLMALDERARTNLAGANGGLLPMDPVWAAFASGVRMMEALAGLPGSPVQTTSSSSTSGKSPAPIQPGPVLPSAAPPAAPPPPVDSSVPPPAPILQPAPDSGISSPMEPADANPMRFFRPGEKTA